MSPLTHTHGIVVETRADDGTVKPYSQNHVDQYGTSFGADDHVAALQSVENSGRRTFPGIPVDCLHEHAAVYVERSETGADIVTVGSQPEPEPVAGSEPEPVEPETAATPPETAETAPEPAESAPPPETAGSGADGSGSGATVPPGGTGAIPIASMVAPE